MKQTVLLLVALAVLTGAAFSPNEVRAPTALLRCQLQTDPNPFDPRYFKLGITKGWFDHRYAYQGYEKKRGSVKDHGQKLELIGLKFVDGRVFIEKLPRRRSDVGAECNTILRVIRNSFVKVSASASHKLNIRMKLLRKR